MKQLRIAALAAMLTVGVSGTTLADTDFGALRYDPMAAIEAGDQLGLEVIPRTELEEVRGEFISGWVRTQAVKAVKKAMGNKAAQELDSYLHDAGIITYAEYRDQFGWKAAVMLSAIPWYLRPQIISDY
jgi:hypothetical protein